MKSFEREICGSIKPLCKPKEKGMVAESHCLLLKTSLVVVVLLLRNFPVILFGWTLFPPLIIYLSIYLPPILPQEEQVACLNQAMDQPC